MLPLFIEINSQDSALYRLPMYISNLSINGFCISMWEFQPNPQKYSNTPKSNYGLGMRLLVKHPIFDDVERTTLGDCKYTPEGKNGWDVNTGIKYVLRETDTRTCAICISLRVIWQQDSITVKFVNKLINYNSILVSPRLLWKFYSIKLFFFYMC